MQTIYKAKPSKMNRSTRKAKRSNLNNISNRK